jgi:NAD(P)-dependent dehydrogenase (short-subunit alcohol dehydrogenase family)
MSTHLTDQIALVTGGGTGIGRATAAALARAGAIVVVAGRTPGPLAETAKLVEAEGGRADAVTADVTRSDEVAHLIGEIAGRYGRLDLAVNNAGIVGTPGPLADLDEDAWAAVVGTNLTGVWLSMKHEVDHMRKRGGAIVNVASTIGAHVTVPGLGAYAATKAGVSALTRAAAKEHVRDGIRINAVSPGPVDTPMSRLPGETDDERDARIAEVLPIGRVATTDEIAAAVLWLASPESSFVVGHDLVIDGGAAA